jgi:hypothetical protein
VQTSSACQLEDMAFIATVNMYLVYRLGESRRV